MITDGKGEIGNAKLPWYFKKTLNDIAASCQMLPTISPVGGNDMHTCLIDSYRALRWIKNTEPGYKATMAYRNITTLDEQMAFLKHYLNGIALDIEDKFFKAPTWDDVQNYAKEEWAEHGNGVLLVWMGSGFGHAVPVINGKAVWGEKTCGLDLTMTFGSDFLCKYIYVDYLI